MSGPIRGIPREQSLEWRTRATELLREFTVIHSLRNRESKETLPDPRLAIIRDKNDIDSSDIVLVNDEFEGASMIGTSMEVIYAFERDKVVVIFGNGHEKDYWLNYHSHVRVKTLEDACDLLIRFFNYDEQRV